MAEARKTTAPRKAATKAAPTAKATPAKNATPAKSPAKKAAPGTSAAKAVPAKKAAAKPVPAKRASAAKAPAKKAPARSAPRTATPVQESTASTAALPADEITAAAPPARDPYAAFADLSGDAPLVARAIRKVLKQLGDPTALAAATVSSGGAMTRGLASGGTGIEGLVVRAVARRAAERRHAARTPVKVPASGVLVVTATDLRIVEVDRYRRIVGRGEVTRIPLGHLGPVTLTPTRMGVFLESELASGELLRAFTQTVVLGGSKLGRTNREVFERLQKAAAR